MYLFFNEYRTSFGSDDSCFQSCDIQDHPVPVGPVYLETSGSAKWITIPKTKLDSNLIWKPRDRRKGITYMVILLVNPDKCNIAVQFWLGQLLHSLLQSLNFVMIIVFWLRNCRESVLTLHCMNVQTSQSNRPLSGSFKRSHFS